ncbi:MAG: hypothetical protein R2750_08495 [Bacteroidales bacterium]
MVPGQSETVPAIAVIRGNTMSSAGSETAAGEQSPPTTQRYQLPLNESVALLIFSVVDVVPL